MFNFQNESSFKIAIKRCNWISESKSDFNLKKTDVGFIFILKASTYSLFTALSSILDTV